MEIIEELGGINFHLYIFDYDNDGFLDVLLPNRLESSVGILNCKFENAPHEQTHFHVETEQAPDKPIWQYSPFQSFVNSNFGSLEDIVLINIDISSTLVVTALYEQGVSLFYPYGKTQFKEIRLIL